MPPLVFELSSLLPVPATLQGPGWLLQSLLIFGFVLHIVAMNIVLGLAILMLVQRIFPSKKVDSKQDAASGLWVFIPKGLALVVNFGVVPLLFLQSVYGYLAYNGDIVMGVWWLSVMLVVMLAYYGLYIATSHASIASGVRTTALCVAVALMLCNAFIFVNKSTIMQDPASFLVHAVSPYGLYINFTDPQLFPRYVHMVLSSIAVGGLSLSAYASWKLRALEKCGASGSEMHRVSHLEDSGFHWYFYATSAQVVIGSWFLITLPKMQQFLFMGGNKLGTSMLIVGLVAMLISLVASRQKKLGVSILAMLVTIFSMVGMRHLLRLSMLESFPAPADGALPASPFAMFAISALATVVIIIYMFRLAFSGKPPKTTPYGASQRGGL